jgi:hypothetical protein
MNLPALNFPRYDFRIRVSGQKSQIFDRIRKKFVELTPEEWVRQHLVRFLAEEKKFPPSLMAVEKEIRFGKLSRRPDVVVYGKDHVPLLVAECKAPAVPVTQEVFDQAARYNLVLGAGYFILTNGLSHFYCKPDQAENRYVFLKEIPQFSMLNE